VRGQEGNNPEHAEKTRETTNDSVFHLRVLRELRDLGE
jgi:hypothetical protein